jgi:hypothetical protein
VNWREALVLTVAHELEHHNQYRKQQREYLAELAEYKRHSGNLTGSWIHMHEWKKKHKWYSEIKAERKAARVLEKWRRDRKDVLYPDNPYSTLRRLEEKYTFQQEYLAQPSDIVSPQDIDWSKVSTDKLGAE